MLDDDDEWFDEEWEAAWAEEIDLRCLEIELIEAETRHCRSPDYGANDNDSDADSP